MKYKVGDKVRVKSLGWYNENKDGYGNVECEGGTYFDKSMACYCGEEAIVICVDPNVYTLSFDGNECIDYAFCDAMLEDLVDEPCEYCENYYYYLEEGYYYPLENQKYCAVCGRELNE